MTVDNASSDGVRLGQYDPAFNDKDSVVGPRVHQNHGRSVDAYSNSDNKTRNLVLGLGIFAFIGSVAASLSFGFTAASILVGMTVGAVAFVAILTIILAIGSYLLAKGCH